MKLDWGNVPAWAGALSLLLAFRLFIRDRNTAERRQVDSVGVWWEVERTAVMPGEPGNDDVKVRLLARNGSELPIELSYVAFEIETRWSVPDYDQAWFDPEDPHYPGVWKIERGTEPHRMFVGPINIAPQSTFEGSWASANLSHLAPASNSSLDFTVEGVRCVLRWALVTDNAGRRWQTRHRKGRQAKRIRWFSLRPAWSPMAWQSPVRLLVRRWRAKLIEACRWLARTAGRWIDGVRGREQA